jgi:hypothetical protein
MIHFTATSANRGSAVRRAAAVAGATLAIALAAGSAQAQGQRSGLGPCRQGALTLIRLIDEKADSGADYKQTFDAVTQTCGPVRTAAKPAAQDRGSCRALAQKLLDTIEDGLMNTPAFARTRETFAASCAPR